MAFRASACGALIAIFFQSLTANAQSPTTSVAPAKTVVTGPPATLPGAETLQFTDAVFDSVLNDNSASDYADIFAFESNDTLAKRQSSSCKTYPGDHLWPSKLIWGIFDLLLGRRLLTTEPIATPCYDSAWGSKNLAECNALVGRFTKATTQCVVKLSLYDIFTDTSTVKMILHQLCGLSSKERYAWLATTLRIFNARSGDPLSMQSM